MMEQGAGASVAISASIASTIFGAPKLGTHSGHAPLALLMTRRYDSMERMLTHARNLAEGHKLCAT